MSNKQYYAGAIWTNHALDRLKERNLSQELAAKVFTNPDRCLNGKQSGTKEYQKRFGESQVTLITKQNEKKEWVILSVWIDPPFPGTKDAKKREEYLKYKKATGLLKFWLTIKKQIGF